MDSENSVESEGFFEPNFEGDEGPPQEDQEAHLSDSEHESDTEDESYDSIFQKLKSKWLLIETAHKVSKCASDLFWRTALQFFPKLKATRDNKKTQQFKTLRRNVYDEILPSISLQIGYKHRASGNIVVVNDTYTHRKQYSPTEYDKLYEIGTVKVCYSHFFKYVKKKSRKIGETKFLNIFVTILNII